MNMIRHKLQATGDMLETVVQMSEGNPDAITALAELLKGSGREEAFGLILDLDDMNMRGSQIWVAYSDYCKKDVAKFKAAVRERDAEMIAFVNGHRGHAVGTPPAVQHGASFEHIA
jgi:hypothetical protein